MSRCPELLAACAKDFMGEDRHKFVVQQIEALNIQKKNIGRPKDEGERLLLSFIKEDVAMYKQELNWYGNIPHDPIKLLISKLEKEIETGEREKQLNIMF